MLAVERGAGAIEPLARHGENRLARRQRARAGAQRRSGALGDPQNGAAPARFEIGEIGEKFARTGTLSSAAAVGVGARMSATWSISVQSVSWPIAEMSGIRLSAAARATISSLKLQRSSSEPPPRATISTSGRGIAPSGASALKPAMAAATSAAEVSPCTRTGQTST